jgi:arylsulfatase A-like enzyme
LLFFLNLPVNPESTMKYLLFTCLLLSLFALRPALAPPRSAQTPPNVVLIFMDDMGYADLSCYGAAGYQTPNMDRLAAEGMRFTNFLSAQPVCTASRAGLLTGCYPNRIGLFGALFPRSQTGINADETTLAELLKSRGYATAIYGKWHLGDHANFLPRKHGFDEYVGLPYSNDMWPTGYDGKPNTDPKHVKARFTTLPLLANEDTLRLIQTLDDQALLTGIYTQKAVDFINRNRKRPFFLYVPHSMPHVPIAASANFRGKTQNGTYGDVMTEIDWSVGEVMKALRTNGLDKNTIVILTSDNGPWQQYGNHAGSTGGLREAKGGVFEGGLRVPCLVRWPGRVPAGQVCNQLASTIDLVPTLARHTGANLPNRRLDGVDLTDLWIGNATAQPRREFLYYYGKNNLMAVRRDNWKLILPHKGRTQEGSVLVGRDGFPGQLFENFEHKLALFNLNHDPGERHDVQQLHPEKVKELQDLAEATRRDLGDDLTNAPGTNRRPVGTVSGL